MDSEEGESSEKNSPFYWFNHGILTQPVIKQLKGVGGEVVEQNKFFFWGGGEGFSEINPEA
jgi:hypothetical protein